MEYMAAGRPVLSTATSAVAEHYGSDVIVLEDETPEGLARCIERVVNAPAEARAAFGAGARAAVAGVNWRTQVENILAVTEMLRDHGQAGTAVT